MASEFGRAGGLVCAGISFPAKADEEAVEIRRQGRAVGQEGVRVEWGRGRSSPGGEGGEEHLVLSRSAWADGLGKLCGQHLHFWWFPRGLGAELPSAAVSWAAGEAGKGESQDRMAARAWPGAASQQGW